MRIASLSDVQILLRLVIVLVLCGSIGLERQARDQIAGLRTHIIVGLGAALFTLVSAYAFSSSRVDPTRIAAQVVSGIGFLGAGAILRHGVTVRGVTTAGALWISAAIGMATAAGYYFGAAATTVIALVALVALRKMRPLVRRRLGTETLSLELVLTPAASIRELIGELRRRDIHVEGLESRGLDDGSEQLLLDVRGRAPLDVDGILSDLSRLDYVARIDLAMLHSLDVVGEDDRPSRAEGRFRPRMPSGRGTREESVHERANNR